MINILYYVTLKRVLLCSSLKKNIREQQVGHFCLKRKVRTVIVCARQSIIPQANFLFTSSTSSFSWASALCLTGSLEHILEKSSVKHRKSPGGPAQLWFSSTHCSSFLM